MDTAETAEPLTRSTPRPVRRPVMTQRWQDVTFLHWPVDPAAVAPLLPPGTRPDVHDGTSWVGLVPFVMRDVRLLGTPPLPWLSAFAETNVRLYAVDRAGRRGVVFRSLEAERLLPVLVARGGYRLPYTWARMRAEADGDVRAFSTSRRWPSPRGAGGRVVVRTGEPVPDDDRRALFLTGRWGLFSRWGRGTAHAPVDHEPWPLHRAEVLELQDDLVEAAGLPRPEGRPVALWSPGVRVRVGLPSRLVV